MYTAVELFQEISSIHICALNFDFFNKIIRNYKNYILSEKEYIFILLITVNILVIWKITTILSGINAS